MIVEYLSRLCLEIYYSQVYLENLSRNRINKIIISKRGNYLEEASSKRGKVLTEEKITPCVNHGLKADDEKDLDF